MRQPNKIGKGLRALSPFSYRKKALQMPFVADYKMDKMRFHAH